MFYFFQGATLGLSATATPGPFQAFLLSQTLKNGWRRTWPAAFAPLISDGPIVATMLLLLTQTPGWFLDGLRIAGGLFVLYLAVGAFLSLKTARITAETIVEPQHQNFLKAVAMNALSPGPYIFWGVLAGPIVLEAWRQSPQLGLSFVLGFYGMMIGGSILFIVLFATASQFGPRVNYALRLISGVALVGFGLYQLGVGLTGVFG
jgi:threonine/homoserine/homoserine lactone efflux protein